MPSDYEEARSSSSWCFLITPSNAKASASRNLLTFSSSLDLLPGTFPT